MKTALIGGSFNPPHYGHSHLIDLIRDHSDYTRVILVPLHTPNHKPVDSIIAPYHRVEMVRRLISTCDFPCILDTCEIERGGISYTYDTILDIEKRYEDVGEPIGVVIGDDLLDGLSAWYRVDDLKRMVRFIVICREEVVSAARQKLVRLTREGFSIALIEGTRVDISSSDIRNRIGQGLDISELLPKEVASYIEEHGLYSED